MGNAGARRPAMQVCWEYGGTNHRRFERPKYLARIAKEKEDKKANAACGLYGSNKNIAPGDLEEIDAANMTTSGETGCASEDARLHFIFMFMTVGSGAQEYGRSGSKSIKETTMLSK